jgi:hypothetical protein
MRLTTQPHDGSCCEWRRWRVAEGSLWLGVVGGGPWWLVGLVSHYAARAIDVRLDSTKTQARLTTRLRGAREFLAPT